MKPTLAWILGRSGLLGSHLHREISARLPNSNCWESTVPRFSWTQPKLLPQQLEQAVQAFAHQVREGGYRWLVVWAAGAGVVGTSEPELQGECETWRFFLDRLGGHLGPGMSSPQGFLFLASSAGGVYGGSSGQPLTEESPCQPISAYGRSKLRQETLLHDWAKTQPHVRHLVGRISNLYGPGQNFDKPQGLISHVCRCLIHHRPVTIFVPLDTIRDYLFVEDCARLVTHCLDRLTGEAAPLADGRGVVKIMASERPTSLSQVLGAFSRITKQYPRVIATPNPVSRQQPSRLQFRSTVWPLDPALSLTDLNVGINRVFQHQLGLLRQGRLHPPGGG